TTRRTGRPVLKVVRVRDAASLAAADAYPGFDLLTDTFDSRLPGGTGRGYDYSLLRALTARRRVIVAGGLDAGTVGDVIRLLRPWGVDVSSAVEASPGVKDPMKVREFIRVVRQADREGRAADRG
ncbi:MAG: phosphoribosylanthranilate isomerase, partial [bacterium]|nr:phosphoribosylanthranilate isomerase [bacterium]